MNNNNNNNYALQVIDRGIENAAPWTNCVRNARIPLRQLVTDEAILRAILSCWPKSVLDVGCGEGWLGRALAQKQIDANGVDGVRELVDAA